MKDKNGNPIFQGDDVTIDGSDDIWTVSSNIDQLGDVFLFSEFTGASIHRFQGNVTLVMPA